MSVRLCMKWKEFESVVSQSFSVLRREEDFFDVTLVSDDEIQISAHKLVLSACSGFFKSILKRNSHSHPLLYLSGVDSKSLGFVLDYIYHGEVQVYQHQLDLFLKVAQKLKIEGLLSFEEPDPPDYQDDQPNPIKTEESLVEDYRECQGSSDEVSDSIPAFECETEDSLQSSNEMPLERKEDRNVESFKEEFRKGVLTKDSLRENILEKENTKNLKVISVKNMSEVNGKVRELIKKSGGFYNCKVCDYFSSRYDHVKEHVERHIEGIKYTCKFCDKTFKLKSSLRMHARKHNHPKNNFPEVVQKLEIGELVSNDEPESNDYENYEEYVSDEEEEIPEENNSEESLEPLKEDLKKSKINIVNDKSEAEGKVNELVKRLNGSYYCKVCNYGSVQISNVKMHVERHIYGLSYPCEFCDESFTLKYNLRNHIRNHHKTEEKGQSSDLTEDFLQSFVSDPLECKDNPTFESKTEETEMTLETKLATTELNELVEDDISTRNPVKEIFLEQKNTKNLKVISVKNMSEVDEKVQELVEKRGGIYKCKVCNYVSSNQVHVKEHVERHIEGISYPCEFCDKTFKLKYNLRNHIRNNHKAEGKRQNSDLTEDFLQSFVSDPLECGDNPTFESKTEETEMTLETKLATSLKSSKDGFRKGKDNVLKISTVNDMSEADVTINELVGRIDGGYHCKVCDYSGNSSHVKEHVERHIEGLSYPCKFCDKTFDLKCNLRAHTRNHHKTGSLPDDSEESRTESVKEEFRKGIHPVLKTTTVTDMSEADEKILDLIERINGRYHCRACSYHSGASAHVKEHVERHIEGLSYPCGLCDKTFNLKYNLRSHVQKQHRNKRL